MHETAAYQNQPVDLPPEALPELGTSEFSDYIAHHLGYEYESLWRDVLLATGLRDRTRNALAALLRNVDSQLRDRREEDEAMRLSERAGEIDFEQARAQHQQFVAWRQRAKRFRGMIERRLMHANRVIREQRRVAHQARAEQDRRAERSVVFELAQAIAAHREACQRGSQPPRTHDQALWRLLDDLTIPQGEGRISLSAAVAAETNRHKE